MKGIILAGGSGTRLYPLTTVISKQLLPVYDKPMIYYPLGVLMLANIRDILIITTPQDAALFKKQLGDGGQFGVNLSYAEQPSPDGLAQAFIIGEEFIGNDSVCLILGDNIFWSQDLSSTMKKASSLTEGAHVFAYRVDDPERYGVVEFDENNRVLSIEEKPKKAKSNYAVTGLYFYGNEVIEISKTIKPSDRGELEITSINQVYMERDQLDVTLMGRGSVWLDAGTHASLLEAGQFIEIIERRQGQKVLSPTEIGYKKGWIDDDCVRKIAEPLKKNNTGKYLLDMIKESKK